MTDTERLYRHTDRRLVTVCAKCFAGVLLAG